MEVHCFKLSAKLVFCQVFLPLAITFSRAGDRNPVLRLRQGYGTCTLLAEVPLFLKFFRFLFVICQQISCLTFLQKVTKFFVVFFAQVFVDKNKIFVVHFFEIYHSLKYLKYFVVKICDSLVSINILFPLKSFAPNVSV